MQGIDSDFAAFIRTRAIVAALAAVLGCCGKWQGLGGLTARHRVLLVLARPAFFKAPQLGDVSQAPAGKFSLVLAALLAAAFLGERPGPCAWAGLGLITAGGAGAQKNDRPRTWRPRA